MGLQENCQRETVDKLDLRKPQTVTEGTALRQAVEQMRTANIGCVIVVDDHQKPLGMYTESMLTELLAHGSLNLEGPIEEFMSSRFPWVKSTDTIADVLDAMQLKNVRMLAVIDDEGKVAGLTGQRGLMEYVADHFPGQVMVQRIGQAPYLSNREGA